MSTKLPLSQQAQEGFSDAASYDQHRPSYPAEAVEKLLVNLGVANQQNARIVELACGTGKFTEALTKRPERFQVVAVEPHAIMRETLVHKNLRSDIKVVDGDASNIPVGADWGDALIAAQAFHWFATDESLIEIHRVLRPGAVFGMIWNVEDYNGPKDWKTTTKWEKALKDIFAEYGDGLPRFRDMKWKDVFDGQQEATLFHATCPKFSLPIGEDSIEWTVWLPDEEVWSRYSTLSQIANQTAEQKEKTKQRVMKALQDEDTKRNEAGEVAVHGVTYFVWTSRI